MFRTLHAWYLRTFLPFEQPDHPLYAAPAVEEDLSDWDDLGTEFGPYEESRPRFKGSMIRHTRSWYQEHEPHLDFDSLPKR